MDLGTSERWSFQVIALPKSISKREQLLILANNFIASSPTIRPSRALPRQVQLWF